MLHTVLKQLIDNDNNECTLSRQVLINKEDMVVQFLQKKIIYIMEKKTVEATLLDPLNNRVVHMILILQGSKVRSIQKYVV